MGTDAGSIYRAEKYRAWHRRYERLRRAETRRARLVVAKHRAWERFTTAVATGHDKKTGIAWARYCDYAARLVAATPPEQVTG